jgi:hypothetical protein
VFFYLPYFFIREATGIYGDAMHFVSEIFMQVLYTVRGIQASAES